ncbi:glycosyltransferase family 4 protein [Mycobacterium sp. AT1]|uniref:glycosyltransferase family 4 protein n=1 Tax=Mycobacterium sp. AT1 TaxID=1961706 RepID=UPI001150BFC3|nr:glycosyltransferase family 4 protein [Mycobacterium sp. AT1]
MASIPAGHPYVQSVVDTSRVTLLPDPVPPGATLPGQWWPPRLLDPEYLRHHVGTFDVLHVHFGFEAVSVDALREVVDVLDQNGVPLVLTVHDLHNPHFADRTQHLARLNVLVPAAAVVVTLTDGAAAEIRRRWGRDAVVLPHPHVLPIDAVGPARPSRHDPVVAVHGKALRANIRPWPILDALLGGDLPNHRVRLDLDDEAMAVAGTADRVERCRRAGVDVRVHRRFSDTELIGYLTEVDLAVLPYVFGTHSGWVEAFHDAGTTVLTPDCGFFTEQHGTLEYGYGPDGLDEAGLLRAVTTALRALDGPRGEDLERRDRRRRQRDDVRTAMVDLYATAVGVASAA